jgi:hypothetical protein
MGACESKHQAHGDPRESPTSPSAGSIELTPEQAETILHSDSDCPWDELCALAGNRTIWLTANCQAAYMAVGDFCQLTPLIPKLSVRPAKQHEQTEGIYTTCPTEAPRETQTPTIPYIQVYGHDASVEETLPSCDFVMRLLANSKEITSVELASPREDIDAVALPLAISGDTLSYFLTESSSHLRKLEFKHLTLNADQCRALETCGSTELEVELFFCEVTKDAKSDFGRWMQSSRSPSKLVSRSTRGGTSSWLK